MSLGILHVPTGTLYIDPEWEYKETNVTKLHLEYIIHSMFYGTLQNTMARRFKYFLDEKKIELFLYSEFEIIEIREINPC